MNRKQRGILEHRLGLPRSAVEKYASGHGYPVAWVRREICETLGMTEAEIWPNRRP